jgi:hypothetical protein
MGDAVTGERWGQARRQSHYQVQTGKPNPEEKARYLKESEYLEKILVSIKGEQKEPTKIKEA